MEFQWNLLFHVSLLLSVPVSSYSVPDLNCPAVQEGRPTTLRCSGDWASAEGRWIFWEERTPLNTEQGTPSWKEIASCDLDNACEMDAKASYQASVKENFKSFETSLRILRSEPEHRENEFQCVVLDYPDLEDDSNKQTHCKLHVYHLPKHPICSVEVSGQNRSRTVKNVTVRCGPERVYPGMNCILRTKWSHSDEITVNNAEFLYNRQAIQVRGHDYMSETCTASFQLSFPGSYQFSVQLRPALDRHLLWGKKFPKSKFSKRIVIPVSSSDPRVKIHKEFTCSENNVYRFVCYSAGFYHRPIFHWFVNTMKVNTDSTRVDCSKDLCFSELFAGASQVGKEISCIVSSGKKNFLATTDFILPLLFVSSPSLKFSNDQLVPVLQTANISHSMKCTSQNSDIEISSLHVVCREGNTSIFYNETEVNENSFPTLDVSFVHPADSIICTCWAKLENLCYADKAIVSLRSGVNVRAKDFSVEEIRENDGSLSSKTLVFVVFASVIVLLVGIALVVFYCPPRHRSCFRNHSDDFQTVPVDDSRSNSSQRLYERTSSLFHPDRDCGSRQRMAFHQQTFERTGDQQITSEIIVDTVIEVQPDPYNLDSHLQEAERRRNNLLHPDDVSVHRNSSMRSQCTGPDEETVVKQLDPSSPLLRHSTISRDWSVHGAHRRPAVVRCSSLRQTTHVNNRETPASNQRDPVSSVDNATITDNTTDHSHETRNSSIPNGALLTPGLGGNSGWENHGSRNYSNDCADENRRIETSDSDQITANMTDSNQTGIDRTSINILRHTKDGYE